MKGLTILCFALASTLASNARPSLAKEVSPGGDTAKHVSPQGDTAKQIAVNATQLETLTLTTLGGKNWSAKAQRGKYVVLNFWATWCKPCVKEMPDFQLLSQRSDTSVLGLAYEDLADAELVAFLSKLKVTYPVAKVDVYAPLPAPLEVPKGLPTTLVFDRGGILLKKFLGPVTRSDIEKIIVTASSVPIIKK